MRQQALEWLRADLALHAKALDSREGNDRQQALVKLQHWLRNPDLACVRRRLWPSWRERNGNCG